jgi:cell division protein FtsB
VDKLKRAIVPGLLLLAVYYAVFGGEYSLFDLHAARAALERESGTLVELNQQIDSLQAYTASLREDPRTLERIARERYGMIREGEILYRFAEGEPALESDSTETAR